jgi:hypothetical protein
MSSVPDKSSYDSEFHARIHEVELDKAIAMSEALVDPFVRHIAALDLLGPDSSVDWIGNEPTVHAISHILENFADIKRDGPDAKLCYEEARKRLTLEK